MQYLVLGGAVDADVFGGAEVGDFVVHGGKFGHFDEIAEAFLLDDFIGDGELVVYRLLGKDGCPCIEGVDALAFQFFGAKVFKEQVEFGEAVGDGGAGQEGGAEVFTAALLDGAGQRAYSVRAGCLRCCPDRLHGRGGW